MVSERLHITPWQVANKIYCVYIAPNNELVQEPACLCGFPANHVARMKTVIDPTTSEEQSAIHFPKVRRVNGD